MAAPVARFSKARSKIFGPANSSKSNVDFWQDIFQSTNTFTSLDPQFHLQGLANESNPNIVLLNILGLQMKIDLVALRVRLATCNLITFFTSILAFRCWIWIDELKNKATEGLSRAEKDRDPFNMPHRGRALHQRRSNHCVDIDSEYSFFSKIREKPKEKLIQLPLNQSKNPTRANVGVPTFLAWSSTCTIEKKGNFISL